MSKPVSYEILKDGLTNLVVENDIHYLLNGTDLNIIVKENAKLELLVFNKDNKENKLNIRLEKDASVRIYNIVINNQDVLLEEDIYLEKQGSKCEITSVLLSSGDAHLNSDINIYHPVGNTTSIFENYGIAKENAKITLNNNATIKQGASKSVVMQKAKGLTLSKNAVIKAMPNLYIDEYDVVANHSAAIGSISKEDLFYLMSRGLTSEEATSLVVIGFIKPIIDNISDESLKEQIYKSFIENLLK